MTVADLKLMLLSQDDDADIMVECSPDLDEYRTEFAGGLRIVDKKTVVIVGISAL